MSNELVSIIVPVYNVGKYIDKCVKTILAQKHRNIEVILVNDGSKDDSLSKIKKLQETDNRIKVISKENGGVSSARNAGLEIATGKYVCFVDGDDYVCDDYVSYLLALCEENNAQIAVTLNQFTNYDAEQIKDDCISKVAGEQAAIDLLCRRITIGVYCKIFKKTFLDANNIRFFENIFIGEGFNFNMFSFMRADTVIYGKRKVYFYRIDNPNSAMTTFSFNKASNELLAMNYIRDNLNYVNNNILNAFNYGNWRTKSDVFCAMIISNSKKKYPDLYKSVNSDIRRGFFYAIKTNTNRKERMRAFIMMVFPYIIPKLQVVKRNRYKLFDDDAANICIDITNN